MTEEELLKGLEGLAPPEDSPKKANNSVFAGHPAGGFQDDCTRPGPRSREERGPPGPSEALPRSCARRPLRCRQRPRRHRPSRSTGWYRVPARPLRRISAGSGPNSSRKSSGETVVSAISRSETTGFFVVIAVDGKLRAGRNHARAVRGEKKRGRTGCSTLSMQSSTVTRAIGYRSESGSECVAMRLRYRAESLFASRFLPPAQI